jgi:hypothetical protein
MILFPHFPFPPVKGFSLIFMKRKKLLYVLLNIGEGEKKENFRSFTVSDFYFINKLLNEESLFFHHAQHIIPASILCAALPSIKRICIFL